MRIVIAEDNALLREGLVALVRERGIEVVAVAEDAEGLLRIVNGHKPDLAIVDVRLRPRSPTRACAPRSSCASGSPRRGS